MGKKNFFFSVECENAFVWHSLFHRLPNLFELRCSEICKGNADLAQVPMELLYDLDDKIDHMPNWLDKRLCCRLKSWNHLTNVSCKKCNVALCFNKERNCFASFHGRARRTSHASK